MIYVTAAMVMIYVTAELQTIMTATAACSISQVIT